MEGGNTSRIVVWLDDTVISRKPLAGQDVLLRRRRADRPAAFRGPTSSSSAGAWCKSTAKNEFRVETKTLALKTDDDGQLQVPTAELERPAAESTNGSSPPATPEGRLAHLGFTNIWALPDNAPTYDQVQGLHDHRPAGLSPGHAGAVQVLGRARALRSARRLGFRRPDLHRRDPEPQGGKGIHQDSSPPTSSGASTARSSCPRTRRWASIRSSCPTAAAARSGSKSTRSPSSR